MNSLIQISSHQRVRFLFLSSTFHIQCPLLWCVKWLKPKSSFVPAAPVSNHTEADLKNKDWVFINYTYKRFEGLTARGAIPSYMKSGKRWTPSDTTMKTWMSPCLLSEDGQLLPSSHTCDVDFHHKGSISLLSSTETAAFISDASEGTSLLLLLTHDWTGIKVIQILSTCLFHQWIQWDFFTPDTSITYISSVHQHQSVGPTKGSSPSKPGCPLDLPFLCRVLSATQTLHLASLEVNQVLFRGSVQMFFPCFLQGLPKIAPNQRLWA